MEPQPPPQIDYSRFGPCPRCHGLMDAKGWCATCATKRAWSLALLIGFLVPCLGFGACSVSVLGSIGQSNSAMWAWTVLAWAGIALIPGGVVAAIIYWLVRKNRINKGGP